MKMISQVLHLCSTLIGLIFLLIVVKIKFLRKGTKIACWWMGRIVLLLVWLINSWIQNVNGPYYIAAVLSCKTITYLLFLVRRLAFGMFIWNHGVSNQNKMDKEISIEARHWAMYDRRGPVIQKIDQNLLVGRYGS